MSQGGKQPTGTLSWGLWVGTAFISSMAWLFLFANELVDILQSMGLILGIPDAFLGLTVLAWGNSVADLVADLGVARKESPAMAAAAIYAGPMLNLLLGLGLAFMTGAFEQPLIMPPVTGVLFSSFLFLWVSLLVSLSVIAWHNFTSPSWYGYVLILLNLSFSVTVIVQTTSAE
jgi:sodium/potassium/calcium exchanger 6